MINIILADDHQMIRDGLKALLKDLKDMQVVAEAENGKEALKQLEMHRETDMVLLDINMPVMNGIETTVIIHEKYPHIRILILSMHNEEEYITKMLQSGAHGYILKKIGEQDLISAIYALAKGERYLCKEVSNTLYEKLSKKKTSNKPTITDGSIQLTEREKEILELIANEFTNQQIADKLFISARTVDTHRRNLLLKLDAKNTAGLIKYALQHGLIQ